MRLSAAHCKVLLVLLVVLIGVWLGRSRLIDQQPDGQDHPRSAEMRSDVERRTRFPGRGEVLPQSQDNRPDHVHNKLSNVSPTAPIPARSVAPFVSAHADGENGAVSDAQEGNAPRPQLPGKASDRHTSWETDDSEPTQELQDDPAIEVSRQSMEDDLRRAYEDAGVAPEDIPDLVQTMLGMIWPEDQQPSDAYPQLSTP